MADELVDILDDAGQTIGTKMKSVAHATGLWHRCVHCWTFLKDSNVMVFQLRSPFKANYPNFFTLAATGHVGAGEDALLASTREFVEETGADIAPGDVKLLEVIKLKKSSGKLIDNEFCGVYFAQIPADTWLTAEENEVTGFFTAPLPELMRIWQDRETSCIATPYPHQAGAAQLQPRTITAASFVTESDEFNYHEHVAAKLLVHPELKDFC